jgi:hypothetical protein
MNQIHKALVQNTVQNAFKHPSFLYGFFFLVVTVSLSKAAAGLQQLVLPNAESTDESPSQSQPSL